MKALEIMAKDKRWYIQYSAAVTAMLYGTKLDGISPEMYRYAELSLELATCKRQEVEGWPQTVWNTKEAFAHYACSGRAFFSFARQDLPYSSELIQLALRVLGRYAPGIYVDPPKHEDVLFAINQYSIIGPLKHEHCKSWICKYITECLKERKCNECSLDMAVHYFERFSFVDSTLLPAYNDVRMAYALMTAFTAFPASTLIMLMALDHGDVEFADDIARLHPLSQVFPVDVRDIRKVMALVSLSIPVPPENLRP